MKELTFVENSKYFSEIDAWKAITRTASFQLGMFGIGFDSKFSGVYSNYNFDPAFTKNTFTNEALTFEKDATKKDSVYWAALRSVPLTLEEKNDYKIKDSIKIVRTSKKYLDSLDRKGNRVSLLSPILGYSYDNSYEKWSWRVDGLLRDLSFNTVQGVTTSLGLQYVKRLNDKGNLWGVKGTVNYGFSEKKARPELFFLKKWNAFSNPTLRIYGGVTTQQFNRENPIKNIDNAFRSLVFRENYMKLFEKDYAAISYSEEITNGVFLTTSLEYATRKPLYNTSDYSFASNNIPYTSNNPLDPSNNASASFEEHSIGTFNMGAKIVFGQKYYSYPDSKFNIENNKYPTLFLGYRKTFGASNTAFNADLLTTKINQDINLGNVGTFKYIIKAATFLKKKDIPFMDFIHANGNRLSFISSNGLDRFGLLEYYSFSTNDRYLEAHLEQNFKGAVLSKIPFINTLNLQLVIGAKTLLTADRKPYSEYTIGLDNLGIGKWRFLRVDYVNSYYNGTSNNGVLFRFNLFD